MKFDDYFCAAVIFAACLMSAFGLAREYRSLRVNILNSGCIVFRHDVFCRATAQPKDSPEAK